MVVGPEPDLGQSADRRELVRGDGEAMRATVVHLVALADGFRATAGGLRAIDTGAWTGLAACAFRARFATAPAQWSGAAEAFGSAAQAWERFRSALVAAQERAGAAVVRFETGAAAALRARAVYAVEVERYLDGLATGHNAGLEPLLDESGTDEMGAARRMLADARAVRDGAAAEATRRIADAAALAPDPPTGWDRRLAEAADWAGAQGIELAHVAGGVGEGVEGLVRLARVLNPADPFNLNHPARFVENASSALAGTVDTVAHPLRLVTDVVGTGWGSDPARAFGHLLPMAAGAASSAARSVLGAAVAQTARSALGVAEGGAARSLWADPRPTSPPFTAISERPPAADAAPPEARPAMERAEPSSEVGDGPAALSEADRVAAERFDQIGGDLGSRLDRLAPTDTGPATPSFAAQGSLPRSAAAGPAPEATARAGGRGVDAHHDPERARQARLTRGDKDFSSPVNRLGTRKSHLDVRGDLVPANPEGEASVVEHVVGRRSPVKGDSPYSSFTSPGARAEVRFGGSTIEVDVVRLQADIDAGLVTGVDVVAPHRVQAAIQADADRIAGRPVDLYVRKGHAASAAQSYGLGAEATAALRQRIIDMANAQRHHEWMIRGVVPARYVVGPHSEGRHG
ncbi:MAG: hypothetical protein QOI16_405 [Pseudonocardiales bacterium]|nr:hypothetical protein [Pseudonocardiales bacterium]